MYFDAFCSVKRNCIGPDFAVHEEKVMIGSLVKPILVDLKINIVVFVESLKLFFKMFISHE